MSSIKSRSGVNLLTMNPIIKKFIEENIEYIENNDFNTVYAKAMFVNHKISIGQLTDVFYDAGLNPLDHMTEIPSLYLDDSKLKTLIVSKNIRKINKSGLAFSNIEHVDLHDNCELTESSFFFSALKKVKIPYIMNEVPDDCFSGCKLLKDVDLNAIDQIGAEAFYNCENLKTLFIPDSIKFIADSAFGGCPVVLHFHTNNEYAINYCFRTGTEYKFV